MKSASEIIDEEFDKLYSKFVIEHDFKLPELRSNLKSALKDFVPRDERFTNDDEVRECLNCKKKYDGNDGFIYVEPIDEEQRAYYTFCSQSCMFDSFKLIPRQKGVDEGKKWIEFKRLEQNPKLKTQTWNVISKQDGSVIGTINWFINWRHYCFFPYSDVNTVFSDRCLMRIGMFVEELNTQIEELK